MADRVMNVTIAGLGGQGVLKASDILAHAAFVQGLDVKKAEVHGMSQRGGSVNSDVRYGPSVQSPMVPEGESDFLLVLDVTQVEPNAHRLAEQGRLITPEGLDIQSLPSRRSLNVAMLGRLSRHLDLDESAWQEAIAANLPEKALEANKEAFALGRATAD